MKNNVTRIGSTVQESYNMEAMLVDLNYADVCYAGEMSKSDCHVYIKDRLRYNVTRNQACPFPGKELICQDPSEAIRFDTGYYNTHHDFGLNTKPEEQILWRSVVDCAPIGTDAYSSISSHQNWNSGRPFISYLFGKTLVPAFSTGVEEIDSMNATFRWHADPPNNSSVIFKLFHYSLM